MLLFFSSGDPNIDKTLHVMSRGLEANKNSSELWLFYLNLYGKRSDIPELRQLCEQALKYAPSYDLYWKVRNIESL